MARYDDSGPWIYVEAVPEKHEGRWSRHDKGSKSGYHWETQETLAEFSRGDEEWAWENIRPLVCLSHFGHIYEAGKCVFCQLEER